MLSRNVMHHLYIGKLELKIPWKNLTRDPLSVTIDEVYVVVGPNIGIYVSL